MKKWIVLLLAATMLFSMAACTTDDPENDLTDDQEFTTDAPSVTGDPNSRENILLELPHLDFQNAIVTIGMVTDCYENLWGAEGTEDNTNSVTHEIFERNAYVEEFLNCDLDFQTVAGSTPTEMGMAINNQILVGGSSCSDFFMATGHMLTSSEMYDYFYSANELKYVDLDKPYWWTDAMNQMSLDGEHLPFLVGDISMVNYQKLGGIYFNKSIYENYTGNDPDALYELVLSGNWTIDEMMTLTKNVYHDVNGNLEEDDDDMYGLMLGQNGPWEEYYHFIEGFGLEQYRREYVEEVDATIPVIDMDNDRCRNAVEKLHALLEQEGTYISQKTGIDGNAANFAAGLTMFYAGRLSSAASGAFAEMTDHYGVLPFPKYDTNQDYVSLVHTSGAATVVPVTKTLEEADMISAIIEAMAWYNYKYTAVELLEDVLSTRYAHDSLTGKVIELLVETASKSFLAENRVVTNYICDTLTVGAVENDFWNRYISTIDSANEILRRYVKAVYGN